MSAEKIESYLITLGVSFEEVEKNSWLINDTEKGIEQVVVIAADPLVVIRVNVMQVSKTRKEELFETLLRLNATDCIHSAYALEGDEIILVDMMEHDIMTFEEFQSSLDSIGLTLAEHFQILNKFRNT